MKTFYPLLLTVILMGIMLISGCTSSKTMGLNSVQLTNQLRPGMTYEEVVEIMGEPKSSTMAGDQWIVRWNLQEMWKGYVPYDFVFDPAEQTLISWSENEDAYQQKQQQLKVMADQLEESQAQTSGGEPVPNFENNAELMRSFAGIYYSFSAVGGGQTGGTERKVMLCADGTFRMQSETGYSSEAGTSEAWGSASQGGGSGTWKITGDMNSGTLVTTDSNGKATVYKFERCASDCVYFGNTKFAYAGPPEC